MKCPALAFKCFNSEIQNLNDHLINHVPIDTELDIYKEGS